MRPPRSRVCAAPGKEARTSAEGPMAATRSPTTAMAPPRRTRSALSMVTTTALWRTTSAVPAAISWPISGAVRGVRTTAAAVGFFPLSELRVD
uniref:Uncharacterized protein n=1 Tax=Arundo donax TaxID=35708 RepID=A0A0A9QG91_ARUDO